MACKKCGCEATKPGKRGTATTVVCAECGAFIAWGKKGEEMPAIEERVEALIPQAKTNLPEPTFDLIESMNATARTVLAKAAKAPAPAPVEQAPCEYCELDYVHPTNYDGGIVAWENIDNKYCPVCGRKVRG